MIDTYKGYLLKAIAKHFSAKSNRNTQILQLVRIALNENDLSGDTDERLMLAALNRLLSQGVVAWGFNLANAEPPYLQITDLGAAIAARVNRDPYNEAGYLAYLATLGIQDAVTQSYIEEAVNCFNNACYRASIVLAGCAVEKEAITLRDALVAHLTATSVPLPKDLQNDKIKRFMTAAGQFIDTKKSKLDSKQKEKFQAYFDAIGNFIRMTRNEQGHPSNVSPLTESDAHAQLLLLPEYLELLFYLQSAVSTL